jgi:hypothetical protein
MTRDICKEYKSRYNKDISTPMFIAVLFTIAKLGKQHRYPTNDEWIYVSHFLHYIYIYIYIKYTMEFYLAIRKNETLWLKGKWMQLEDIMLSKVSQTQERQRPHVFFHMWEIDTIQI